MDGDRLPEGDAWRLLRDWNERVGDPPGLVVVPDVIGLPMNTARRVLKSVQLAPIPADPHLDLIQPLPAAPNLIRPDDVDSIIVLDQKPAAGKRVRAQTIVRLHLGRGPGSAGVRAPLRPAPSPRSTGGAVDEQTGESVP